MGKIGEVPPGALIAGITYTESEILAEAMEILTEEFGPVEKESPSFDVDMTDYYTAEMGKNLKKLFVCFQRPVSLESLPEIKILTNQIETRLARENDGQMRRRVNIDPGYITLAKLVLASTKDYSHRIYIGRGIFAETTLRFIKDAFTPHETTYPDYRTQLALDFFNEVRVFVKRNINQ